MSNRVRGTDDGLARIRASLGASTFHGISVQGHCMGIVARTWRLPSQAAGYGTAFDGAQAVIRAGRMRSGTNPPVGAVPWWAHRSSDNRPGHVATIDRPGVCIGNVGSTIQSVPLSRFGNLRWLGWCWPEDVPGWGSAPTTPPPTTPTPIDLGEDDAMTLIRTNNGQGRHFILSGGRMAPLDRGYVISTPGDMTTVTLAAGDDGSSLRAVFSG
jgi:hypothetical protein